MKSNVSQRLSTICSKKHYTCQNTAQLLKLIPNKMGKENSKNSKNTKKKMKKDKSTSNKTTKSKTQKIKDYKAAYEKCMKKNDDLKSKLQLAKKKIKQLEKAFIKLNNNLYPVDKKTKVKKS
jgi:predicted RNase H-like nuclease (RuvC/YqgF family)